MIMNEANRELCAATQDAFRRLSKVVLGVWGLMLLFILLSGSRNLIDVGEAILVASLSITGWLIFAKLTQDLFYGRQLLRTMTRNRYVQSRMLSDFGLSVSAAGALLPDRLRAKALLSLISAVVALTPILWSPPIRFYIIEDFRKLQHELSVIDSNATHYHLSEVTELLLGPNYMD
jgi:hypothetical protein